MNEGMAIQQYDEAPLRAADIRASVNLIQEVMSAVMKDGQHYGLIPGAGNKPTLLKPGAEKIMATFRLSADPDVEDMSTADTIRYRVKCKLLTPAGYFKGSGIGECSSLEEKYMWRAAVSDAEYNATPEDMRRIKFKRNDEQIRQIRTNPYDLANTILKMAKKRALVDAVLTVTAASDIFTQDIAELPKEYLMSNGGGKAPVQQPQSKSGNGGNGGGKAPVQQPQSKSGNGGNGGGKPISDAQVKRFFALAKKGKKTDEMIHNYIKANGWSSPSAMPWTEYERACSWAEKTEDVPDGIGFTIPDDCPHNPAECAHSSFGEDEVFCCGTSHKCPEAK